MTKYSVEVNDIGKRYRIGMSARQYNTLRDTLYNVFQNPKSRLHTKMNDSNSFWALKNVNFKVEEGKAIGIIGRNGAGKSTLLKILSRVTEPTEGTAVIRGRVGSLLEVGTGFHPELTGRENIFLNGAILGMKRAEIEKKLDEIIAFSEVEKFVDTPVKRYSSGMYLRLAFAVAAHLDPEILVVDEVLAVGDAEFQRKCLGKMSDVANQGRTVLFVSHNMSAIMRLTDQTVVLDHGKVAMQGPTSDAVDYYLSQGFSQEGQREWKDDEFDRDPAPFHPEKIRILSNEGNISDTVRSTEKFYVEFDYSLDEDIAGLRVGLYIISTRGEFILTSFDVDDPIEFEKYSTRKAGKYTSRCEIPADFLNEGRFVVGVNASIFKIRTFFHDEQAIAFNVNSTGAPGTQWPENRTGLIRPRLNWEIESKGD
ncbi:MAG: ABC transporter ATP-binding protein [Anaerolineaceae bacterium]|nr:ABC transporter ATP-binding protein [Anaerolineaceae bacterium]